MQEHKTLPYLKYQDLWMYPGMQNAKGISMESSIYFLVHLRHKKGELCKNISSPFPPQTFALGPYF